MKPIPFHFARVAMTLATAVLVACSGGSETSPDAGTTGGTGTKGSGGTGGTGGTDGGTGGTDGGTGGTDGGTGGTDGGIGGTSGTGGTGGTVGACTPTAADTVTTSVAPGGGTVTLGSTAWVVFPTGAFSAVHSVRLEKTSCATTAQEFVDSTAIFQPGNPLGYEIRVNTGGAAPLTPVEASIQIPSAFAVPAGSQAEVFAQISEEGDSDSFDHFELIDSRFDATANVVTVTLPSWAFTSSRRPDGTFEAIVTIASTPGVSLPAAGPRRSNLAESLAGDGKILPPMKPLTINARCLAAPQPSGCDFGIRVHPITGETKMHYGTDFVARGSLGPPSTEGDPIYAVGDGVVARAFPCKNEYVNTQGCVVDRVNQTCTCTKPGDTCKLGCQTSFGNYVVLRMKGVGSATYAHLQSFAVEEGDKVLAGQEIGVTDHTGSSTGPHLHFELAGTGPSKAKVDPRPRIEDRLLTWHLTATADYEFTSLISATKWLLKLRAEADLVMRSDGPAGMALTITGGTFYVQSYTGQNDRGSEICPYVFTPTNYPIKMNDGTGIPQVGETFGSVTLVREGNKLYRVYMSMFTSETPTYTEVCAQSTTTNGLALANFPWLAGEANPKYLDPETVTTTGSRTMVQSDGITFTATNTYAWSLDKTY